MSTKGTNLVYTFLTERLRTMMKSKGIFLVRFDKDCKWLRLWSMEFPETHERIRNADSDLEVGYFGSSSADFLSPRRSRLFSQSIVSGSLLFARIGYINQAYSPGSQII